MKHMPAEYCGFTAIDRRCAAPMMPWIISEIRKKNVPQKIKEDMENFIRFSLMGSPITLKKDVVPHIFNCHPDRTVAHGVKSRCAVEKLNRKRLVADILKQSCDVNSSTENTENTENIADNSQTVNEIQAAKYSIEHSVTPSSSDPARVLCYASTNSVGRSMLSGGVAEQNKNANEHTVGFQDSFEEYIVKNIPGQKIHVSLSSSKDIKSFGESTVPENINDVHNLDGHHSKLNVSETNEIQSTKKLIKKHFRSKAVLVKPQMVNAECSAKPMMVDKKCSPIHIPTDKSSSVPLTVTSSHTITDSSHSEYQPSPEEILELHEEQDLEMKRVSLRLINYFITVSSKSYIGIPSQWLWIIDELQKLTGIPSDHIKLILMKLKINDTFRRLGDQFGLSSSAAGKIFSRNIDQIAHVLKSLIFCPVKSSLKKNLPIPFRMNFSNVTGIIDCFEIQIEKPSNPLHQALTWSEYKKCNTLKFLICISADGLIIFISRGYGGRVSDMELFDKCGIMDILPADSSIMADRGFKQIQTILQRKNIELVRPPSVSSQEKLSKEQVILTKRIASLRIHVERVIRRIREFSLLQPHSTLDHSIMPYIDSVIQIAAALINLQEPVIRM